MQSDKSKDSGFGKENQISNLETHFIDIEKVLFDHTILKAESDGMKSNHKGKWTSINN